MRRGAGVNTKEEKAGSTEKDCMEIICNEERCSLGHGACFACFLIVSVFIIQMHPFKNSHMGYNKGKCVHFLFQRTHFNICTSFCKLHFKYKKHNDDKNKLNSSKLVKIHL